MKGGLSVVIGGPSVFSGKVACPRYLYVASPCAAGAMMCSFFAWTAVLSFSVRRISDTGSAKGFTTLDAALEVRKLRPH